MQRLLHINGVKWLINRFILAHGNENGLFVYGNRGNYAIYANAHFIIVLKLEFHQIYVYFCIAQAASQAAATAQVWFCLTKIVKSY